MPPNDAPETADTIPPDLTDVRDYPRVVRHPDVPPELEEDVALLLGLLENLNLPPYVLLVCAPGAPTSAGTKRLAVARMTNLPPEAADRLVTFYGRRQPTPDGEAV